LLGITTWSVQDRLRRQGIPLTGHRTSPTHRTSLSERQQEVIDGELLGDGHLQRRRAENAARLRWSFKSRQHIDLLCDEFAEFDPTVRRRRDRDGWTMWTQSNQFLTGQHDRWYGTGMKRVPRDLRLTPLAAFHWYIGDGSIDKNQYAVICSEGFPTEDNEFLVSLLAQIGIPASLQRRGDIGHRIYLGAKGTQPFLDYIGHCRVLDYAHKWGGDPDRLLAGVSHMGTGDWLRGRTEHCLMAVRGRPTVTLTNHTTLIEGPLREHSRKPSSFFQLVESLCPGSKLEMFAREERDGWTAWGDEKDKFRVSAT
jgi:hypothetical protein